MPFSTAFKYESRATKPEYVWRKYKSVLRGEILDVGADQCGLKSFLPSGTRYVGVDLDGPVDLKVNLEEEELPFGSGSFDCVLCLDVLEHLDNIHDIFDELCRITRSYLIICLPNPWASFMNMLVKGYYRHTERPMKFYSLPVDPPPDRHKWFFGLHEAERFIVERSRKNCMEVIQLDKDMPGLSPKMAIYRLLFKFLKHRDVAEESLWGRRLWALLAKHSPDKSE